MGSSSPGCRSSCSQTPGFPLGSTHHGLVFPLIEGIHLRFIIVLMVAACRTSSIPFRDPPPLGFTREAQRARTSQLWDPPLPLRMPINSLRGFSSAASPHFVLTRLPIWDLPVPHDQPLPGSTHAAAQEGLPMMGSSAGWRSWIFRTTTILSLSTSASLLGLT